MCPCRSVIQAFLLSTVLIFALTIPNVNGRTIDEAIVAASKRPDHFTFMTDLEGDRILHELDMVLTYDQYRQLTSEDGGRRTSYDSRRLNRLREKRKAWRDGKYRWTDNVMPYQIAEGAGFSSRDRYEFQEAMAEWSHYTCIRFREKTQRDYNYVKIDDGEGCSSNVGMWGGRQQITLAQGCRTKGVIIHEIGHALGFHHEQNRPDRDDYVEIIFENIPPAVHYNFKKYPWSAVNTFDVPYDYRSIMHYGGISFSLDGSYTIKTKDKRYQHLLGNRKGLSFGDIKMANLMYSCSKRCSSSIRCPEEGFLDKNCQCQCPGDPIRPCGSEVRTTAQPITTSSPEEECRDENEWCPTWVKSPENWCENNSYVKMFCKLSCDTCKGAKVVKKSCQDQHRHCQYWKSRGFCAGAYANYMSQNCALSCGICKDEIVPRQTTISSTKGSVVTSTGEEQAELKGENSGNTFMGSWVVIIGIVFLLLSLN